MLKIIITVVVTLLVLVLAGAGTLYSGIINVAADNPHNASVGALLELARERSIAVRAEDIEVPDLRDASLIRSGAGNYEAMCVVCHLAPGVETTELHQNLYPTPPNLTLTADDQDPARVFWTIKHGIKATGMPAWGKSMQDEYIWGLVAFLDQLPSLGQPEYQAIVASSDGHQHGGGETETQGHSDQHTSEKQKDAEPDVHLHRDGSQHVH